MRNPSTAPVIEATKALVERIPTLSYVFYMTTSEAAAYWKVERMGNSFLLVRISPARANRIREEYLAQAGFLDVIDVRPAPS